MPSPLYFVPEKYSGECIWEDYEQNFEACAWNKGLKAKFLAVSLVGSARELLQGVYLKNSNAYSMLLRRLRKRYCPGELSNVHRNTLRARRQKEREGPSEL